MVPLPQGILFFDQTTLFRGKLISFGWSIADDLPATTRSATGTAGERPTSFFPVPPDLQLEWSPHPPGLLSQSRMQFNHIVRRLLEWLRGRRRKCQSSSISYSLMRIEER